MEIYEDVHIVSAFYLGGLKMIFNTTSFFAGIGIGISIGIMIGIFISIKKDNKDEEPFNAEGQEYY